MAFPPREISEFHGRTTLACQRYDDLVRNDTDGVVVPETLNYTADIGSVLVEGIGLWEFASGSF